MSDQGPSAGYGAAHGQPGGPAPGMSPGYLPPELSPADQRTWACVAHLSHLAGSLIGLPVVGPLIVYLVFKERGVFIRRQAAEALNFQLLLLAVYLAAVFVSLVTLGVAVIVAVPLAGIVAVVGLVITIIAAVRASQGVDYRYPISWRLVH